ncbi:MULTISPECIES: PH domain-containing protein [Kordiimonas]|uniref:PH domain-containing protein n=1 Tax=Kordiimonas TaxID=288021 RepID=UPI00257A986D|nr:PH domain-containing protein [Kordiimonas sp. UBA4487]
MTLDTFSNAQVQTQDIPSAGTIAFEPLHQRHAVLLITESLLVWAVPSVAFTVLLALGKIESSFLSAPWGFLLPLAALPIIFIACLLQAKHSGFAARTHDIHFKAGVIWRKRVALPFNRIQHIEIERNPIERAFGLSTLKFFTAGGGSADMKIPALGEQQATDLKSFVLKLAGEADDRA